MEQGLAGPLQDVWISSSWAEATLFGTQVLRKISLTSLVSTVTCSSADLSTLTRLLRECVRV